MAIYGDSNFLKKVNLEGTEYLIPTHDNYHQYSPRYYLDGVNGSDDNDGLTEGTAFKTLEHFLELLNRGMVDIRCFIISPGIYTISKTTVEASTVHITARVAGVIIQYDGGGTYYNSHLNFQGLDANNPITFTSQITSDNMTYFENCATKLANVVFENINPIQFYGGYVDSTNVTYTQLWIDGTQGEFIDTTFTDCVTRVPLVIRRGSDIVMRGKLTFNDAQTNNNLMHIERSTLRLHTVNITNTTEFSSGKSIQARTAIIMISTGALNALDNLTASPHDFGAITLCVTSNTTIPS